MNNAREHAEWLSLVETSGPFVSIPVLLRVFPQGLDARDPDRAARLREAYEDWLERGETIASVHRSWVLFVLTELLEYSPGLLVEGQAIPPGLEARLPQHGETLHPDLVVRHADPAAKGQLLISVFPPTQDLTKPVQGRLWNASPGTRMMELLHAADLPIGLVTNGEQWMLVYAPRGETTGFSSWYADLWMQEPVTLRAFHSLLHLRRLIGVVASDTLAALLAESSKDQQEVTDQLGKQVRQAVEVLVHAFDQIDVDSKRTLLRDVDEKELYNSALTVMMRLVFLFSAEERGLLPLNDPFYEEDYSASSLCALLRGRADQHGEEVLERRHDAWSRLLATFRAVHGGVRHDRLQLPAYGGSLFDPDRYPFLEGRSLGTLWKETAAKPLPINNRVVLHLLEALQELRMRVPGGGPAEKRRLSFRSLDIEQIGHVYEGLLDHTARRATDVVLGLAGKNEPEIALTKIEEVAATGEEKLIEFLVEVTGRSEKALRKALLAREVDEFSIQRASVNDTCLAKRLRPFALLLREDSFGGLLVIPLGCVYVTSGSDRRSTGTHYTPRSLTEPVVQYTLEPLVYEGPAEGLLPIEWKLKTPKAILALKICDMAMGSGAFLVQVCRYLSERLVESWAEAERAHPGQVLITPEGDLSDAQPSERLIPAEQAERLAIARRYVADRCLYGVDINPMAVEMAKLSLWLITLQRERPFTFLDHALKCGDSLLGIDSLERIKNFSLRSGERQLTFATANLLSAVAAASAKRLALEELPSNDVIQIDTKIRLNVESEAATKELKALADALIAFELLGLDGRAYEEQRTAEAEKLRLLVNRDADASLKSRTPAISLLSTYARDRLRVRRPFHWALEFPEVFSRGGFDAIVGNPPYLGAPKLTGTFGNDFRQFLVAHLAHGVKGLADLCAYFVLRTESIVTPNALCGLVVTSAISEGDTRTVGLQQLSDRGWEIVRATSRAPWPGAASVTYSSIWMSPRKWSGAFILNGKLVAGITPMLDVKQGISGPAHRLIANLGLSFNGVKVYGDGFVLTPEEAHVLMKRDERNKAVLYPYVTTKDVNSHPTHRHSAWAIRFFDWPLTRESAPPDYTGHVASDFPDCLEIVESRVKPERTRRDDNGDFVVRDPMPQQWWIYGEKRPGLYAAISNLKHILAVGTQATKYIAFAVLDKEMVFSHSLSVIADDSFEMFAVLHSSIHEVWARHYGGYNLALLRYSPTDLFETFPFPTNAKAIEEIGSSYHEHRRGVMLDRGEGLTDIYNRLHDRMEHAADIERLRTLQEEMDLAVAAAYSWNDLDLGHGFHATNQGERYTINEDSRRSVLDRLLALNHLLHAEEIKAGLHDKKPKKTPANEGSSRRVRASKSNYPELF